MVAVGSAGTALEIGAAGTTLPVGAAFARSARFGAGTFTVPGALSFSRGLILRAFFLRVGEWRADRSGGGEDEG
jgi:hypothetical protein